MEKGYRHDIDQAFQGVSIYSGYPCSGWAAYLLTGVVPREALGRLGVPEPGSELAGASLGSSAASPCSAARAIAAFSSSIGSVNSLGGP